MLKQTRDDSGAFPNRRASIDSGAVNVLVLLQRLDKINILDVVSQERPVSSAVDVQVLNDDERLVGVTPHFAPVAQSLVEDLNDLGTVVAVDERMFSLIDTLDLACSALTAHESARQSRRVCARVCTESAHAHGTSTNAWLLTDVDSVHDHLMRWLLGRKLRRLCVPVAVKARSIVTGMIQSHDSMSSTPHVDQVL